MFQRAAQDFEAIVTRLVADEMLAGEQGDGATAWFAKRPDFLPNPLWRRFDRRR